MEENKTWNEDKLDSFSHLLKKHCVCVCVCVSVPIPCVFLWKSETRIPGEPVLGMFAFADTDFG